MKSLLATPVVHAGHQSVVSSILKIGIDCSQLLSRRIARLRCNFSSQVKFLWKQEVGLQEK